jgi:hypothetical protein
MAQVPLHHLGSGDTARVPPAPASGVGAAVAPARKPRISISERVSFREPGPV